MIERFRREPERIVAWIAIAAWAVQPFTLGPLLGDALDPTRDTFRTSVSWALWIWWLAVLIAVALPRPLTLTIVRVGGLAAIPAGIWATIAINSTSNSDTATIAVGMVGALIAAGVLLLPALADRFVDGASYGDERRFVLRPPSPVLIGLMAPSWVLSVAGLVAGPLFLTDEQWIVGAVLVVVGLPLALLAARALHQLTNRFVVFVPNGLVVHDLTVLREPVLFTTREIAGIAPAPADTAAEDLTSSALGLILELNLTAPATLPFVSGRTDTETRSVRSLLIAPSRPAAVMRLAQERGFRIV